MVSNAEPPHSENCDQTWECLPAISHYVDQITFSPDGKILASKHKSSTECVKLWDVTTGQELYSAEWSKLCDLAGGHQKLNFFSYPLFFSPDGKTLTCDGFIWDLELNQVVNVRTLNFPFNREDYRGFAVSPDLQIAVAAYWGYREDENENDFGVMKLWKTSTGKEIYTLFLGRNVTYSFYVNQFSPNGIIFASLIWFRGSSDFYPDGRDQEKIKLWEVKTGMELCSIPLPDVTGETKYSGILAFSSDGCILASNCGDTWRRVILLSDTSTGKELCRFQGLERKDKFSFHKVVSLAFSPDNQLLASGDSTGKITLWQLNKGRSQSLTARKIRTLIGNVSNEPIRTLVFSPDGRILASGAGDNNGGITLWDVKSGKKHQTFLGHPVLGRRVCANFCIGYPGNVAVSPDGKMIATVDRCKSMIKFWDTQSGAFLRCVKYKWYIGKLIFSQDGKFLVSVYDSLERPFSQSKILIWEVAKGREIQSIQYSRQGVWGSRTVNQYGDILAIVEQPKNFHSNSKKLRIKVLQVRTGQTICTLTGDYNELPWQIVFSPNKRLVATRHSMSEFAIWENATGRLIRTINTENREGDTDPGYPDPVLFSPNGEILAVTAINNITLWQVSSGEKIRTIYRYHGSWGSCLAFSPNGQTLAFSEFGGGGVSRIQLCDVETGSKTCIFQQTFSMITSLDFSGNGQVLVSSYTDGTIKVWQQK